MSVIAFPRPQRRPIADPVEVNALEAALCAVARLIEATGGAVALGGCDLRTMSVVRRIRLLSRMYDAGEVAFGYFDGRTGETVRILVEKLSLPPHERTGWRAEVFLARAGSRQALGALSAPDASALGVALLRAVGAGFAEPLDSPGKALARLARL